MMGEQVDVFSLAFTVESEHRAVSSARRRIREFLDARGTPPCLAADVELIVAELAANAADLDNPTVIGLEVRVLDEVIHLTVTSGKAPATTITLPIRAAAEDPLADRGRGLTIVDALADGVWVHEQRDSTSVTCLLNRHRQARWR